MARLHLRGKEKGLDKETIHVLNKKRESGNDLEKRLSTEYLEKEFVKGQCTLNSIMQTPKKF